MTQTKTPAAKSARTLVRRAIRAGAALGAILILSGCVVYPAGYYRPYYRPYYYYP